MSKAELHNGFPVHSTCLIGASKPTGTGYVSFVLVLIVPFYNQPFMDTATYLTRSVLIFYLPLLVASFPLLSLLKLTSLESVRASAPLLFLSTLGSGLMGCFSTFVAFMISSYGMAIGVEKKGLCVIGALTFLLVGGFFTVTSLLIGLYRSIYRAAQ